MSNEQSNVDLVASHHEGIVNGCLQSFWLRNLVYAILRLRTD